jgi:cation transport regulator
MPYASIFHLPPAVRRMPEHAQEIFRAAFNSAWAAVKKRYRRASGDASGEWIPLDW